MKAAFFTFLIIFFFAACSRGPVDFDDRIAKAEAHIGLGNYLLALNDYKALLKDCGGDPRRAGILLKIADLHATGLRNSEKAIEVLSQVIHEEPLSEAARLARERRAAIREREGDYEGAIEDYSALLKHFAIGTRSDLYKVQVAGVYLSMRDYRQARTELKPLFQEKEMGEEVLEKAIFIAAESYFLEGKSRRAAGYYRWLLEEFPDSSLAPEAKLHMATCYEEMGLLGVAGAITKSAGDDYPNSDVIEARLDSLKARGSNPEVRIPRPAPEKDLQSDGAQLASPPPDGNNTKGD